jgi:hypothetical protein
MMKLSVPVEFAVLAILAVVTVAGLPLTAHGLVINASPASATNPVLYTTVPGDDPGWSYVGPRGSDGDGIYIGNGWVLTANHIGAGSIKLGATTYAYDNTVPTVQLTNPLPATGFADLLMFKIVGDPGLSPLNIRSSAPVISSSITMIGTGNTRGSALQDYAITSPSADTLHAYQWGASDTRTKTWGTNNVDAASFLHSGNNTYSFAVDFDNVIGEAQAISHDSGGGVFIKNLANQWELAGVMLAATSYQNGAGTKLAGYTDLGANTLTYIADLSLYRSQIEPYLIPEPTSIALLAVGGLTLIRRRNRRAA